MFHRSTAHGVRARRRGYPSATIVATTVAVWRLQTGCLYDTIPHMSIMSPCHPDLPSESGFLGCGDVSFRIGRGNRSNDVTAALGGSEPSNGERLERARQTPVAGHTPRVARASGFASNSDYGLSARSTGPTRQLTHVAKSETARIGMAVRRFLTIATGLNGPWGRSRKSCEHPYGGGGDGMAPKFYYPFTRIHTCSNE